MKAMKKAIALLLCVVMTVGLFAVSGITIDDLAGLFPKAEAAYTFTTRNNLNATKTISQTKVVGVNSSFILGQGNVLARDFWYNVYANDYFGGHSEPTDLVVPGLADSEDYTPQGMTYWEAKNWILISAYDASGNTGDNKYATVIYAIDVASGQMVALFRILDADGTVNTSHGGGIAVSANNFYFADSGSNVSYIPLSEMNVSAGTSKDIKIKGTLNLAGEMGGASTSYCCYDDGVLWVGNFFISGNEDYGTAANAGANSMLLGYKLEGDSSQEEWDYLCGKYKNVLNVTTASGTGTSNGANLTWNAFKNGESVDITGSITAPTAYVGEFCPSFGSFTLEEGKEYIISFISTNSSTDVYMFGPTGHCNVNGPAEAAGTKYQLADGRWYYEMSFVPGIKPTGADSGWSNTATGAGGAYTIRFDQDAIQAGEARDFAITDIKITEANGSNTLNLTTTSGTATKTNASMSYSIATNDDSSFTITGTATNTSGSELELTANYATVDLVEGETYTMSFVSNNQLTDAYIFAPTGACGYNDAGKANATHMRLFAQRGTSLGDGTYYYETTFTAGKILDGYSGGDYTWPAAQSTDGKFTGTYTIRFDQDSIQSNETRNFTISNIMLKKSDTSRPSDRIHFVGTAGNPTYVVAIDNTYDKIQYAMVDNGKVYLSRSWNRNMSASTYVSELTIFDIDLNVPGTNAYTINGSTRSDCYYATGGTSFYNLAMAEALCVVDDYLYMFYESGAYTYRAETSNNKCTQPVDVVWKVDQYAILGQERRDSVGGSKTKASSNYVETYEKVNSLDEINYTDEYMIVYESEAKAANGNKILYALDSYGGFKDGLVPKNSSGTQINTGDSLGIVGHPITKYAVEGDIIKLNDAASDDKDSLLWNIIGADTGAFRLENMDSYYGEYKNLYFGSRLMYMRNSKNNTTALDHMKIKDNGDGTFSFYYSGNADYYLWCNDGTVPAYMDVYDKIYSNTYAFGGDNPDTTDTAETATGVKAYAGQTEQAGTFHSDAFAKHTATDSGNKTGYAVDEKFTKFKIYRRADDTSASGKSGLATDLNAVLNSDGTYTLTLESYSTGQTITKKSTDGKPIDFVFVLDTSGSMNTNYDVPYWGDSGMPETYDIDLSRGTGGENGQRNVRYVYPDGTETYLSMWPQTAADDVASLYNPETGDDFYLLPNGEVYNFDTSSGDRSYAGSLCQIDADTKANAGGYYWTDRTGDANRLTAMKQSTLDFIEQIAAHAEQTGLQHRIAIVQYGSTSYLGGRTGEDENFNNTGLYATTTGITMTNFGTLCTDKTARTFTGFGNNVAVYENAFYPASHDNLEQIINNISVSGDPDTFVEHGMEMALNIFADQMTLFNTTGDRVGDKIYGTYSKVGGVDGITEDSINASACVINITDGVPGYGSDDDDAAYCSARKALEHANAMKMYDVDIYTVQLGSESGGLNNANFLNALSSNYINGSATSKYESSSNTFNIGTSNGSGYYLQHNLSNKMHLNSLFDHLSQAGDNSLLEVETVTLGSDSIMLQSLGDTFMLTNDSVATAKTSQIYYDSLGRIYEETPQNANYTITKNVSNNTVQLTGFNYSTEYVADGNAGKKLYLQIDGVLLNPDKEHGLNIPISNDAVTAIYANSSAISSGTATQYFPQAYFEVPTYNYIYDYGVQMVNTSIYGTPLSFDTVPDKQSTYATGVNIEGDAAISYNGTNVVSNIATDCDGPRISFVLLEKPAGGYYWAKINMLPASNVYFEETYIANIANDKTKDWTNTGSNAGILQSISSAGDIYGYDAAYETNRTYSNGVAKTVTLDASNKRSDTQTVTLTGTGFDLISACGKNTGMQTVTIKQNGAVKRVIIVDTFFNDTYGTLNQVPVVHYEGDYGTYTVEITAVYLSSAGAVKNANVSTQAVDGTDIEAYSAPADEVTAAELLAQVGMEDLASADVELVWMDDDSILNGGTGAAGDDLSTQADGASVSLVNYLDGIRVYNPVPTGKQSAYIGSEAGAKYYNVINSLASSSDIISGNGATSFIGYVEKILGGSINFSDYSKSNAPKNEVYLTNEGNSALTFKVKLDNASSRVMLGMRAAYGTPVVVINGKTITVNNKNISTATEMYYDITDALTVSNGYATITIKNTAASTLLAVNNVKVVNGSVAALASDDILEVASLMEMDAVGTIDVNTYEEPASTVILVPAQNPDPSEAPDPDLDPAGEYIITTPENNAGANEEPHETFLDRIIEFFKNLFEKISGVLESFFAKFAN